MSPLMYYFENPKNMFPVLMLGILRLQRKTASDACKMLLLNPDGIFLRNSLRLKLNMMRCMYIIECYGYLSLNLYTVPQLMILQKIQWFGVPVQKNIGWY